MVAFGNTCKRLLTGTSGNVMPIAAISMIVLAGLVGGGVDMSRAYMVQNRLQNACDAGVLAGRRAVSTDGFDSAAESQATTFFAANFDKELEDVAAVSFVPTSPDNGNTVNGTARTTVDTLVMKLFNFDEIPVDVECTASMSVGNSDVMMVLDTTGSMDWDIDGDDTDVDTERRIHFLREAMKGFYDTVSAASAGSNARIRFGFVPYSSSVNVGSLLDPNWIVDSMDIQSRIPEFETTTETVLVGYEDAVYSTNSGTTDTDSDSWSNYSGSRYSRSWQCENAMPENTDWSNHGGSSTNTNTFTNDAGQRITTTRTSQDQRRTAYRCRYSSRNDNYRIQDRREYREIFTEEVWTEDPIYEVITSETFKRWLYKKVEDVDVSRYKLFESVTTQNGTDGTDEAYVWSGCIEERDTDSEASFSFSSISGMSPYTWDLDLDTLPNGTAASQWRPLWEELAYRRGTSQYIYRQDQGYDGHKTNTYCPSAAQLFETMTEDEFDDYADALTPRGSTYLDLGLIWGGRLSSPEGLFSSHVTETPANGGAVARHLIFLTDGEMQPSFSIHSAYGTEYYDQRVTDDGISNIKSRHTSRFRAVCDAIKAKGIRIWVISFTAGLSSDLAYCASEDSDFDAADAEQLNDAFQEIAKDVGELRITQ